MYGTIVVLSLVDSNVTPLVRSVGCADVVIVREELVNIFVEIQGRSIGGAECQEDMILNGR